MLDIRIKNREFTDVLNDQNSQAYKDLRAEVTEVLNKAYACFFCPTKESYLGVAEMSFRKGSVIADSVLLFDTTVINAAVVRILFLEALGSTETAGLEIDKDFVTDSRVTVPVTSATTTQPSTTSQVLSTHTTHRTQSTKAHHLSSSFSKFTTASTKSTILSTYSSGSATTTTSNTSSETSTSVSTPLKSTPGFTNNTTSLPETTRTSVSTATTSRNYTSKKSSPPLRYTTKGPADQSTSSSHNGSTITSTRPTSGLTALKQSTGAPHPLSVVTSGGPEGHSTVRVTTSTRRPFSDSHSPSVKKPSSEPRMTMSSSSVGGGVPGWAIALLVLACVILLLVIVVLILVLWRWCCHREEPGFVYVSGEPNPYGKAKQVPLGPEVMAKEPSFKNLDDAEKPKRTRSGFYVVNPE
ncbi:putative protein TPRXL [Scleropages formosus]|uniref:putative protein TPRXL n=1 Tax=Scleropages formosus TaxID=113540 RepID=UPI00087847E8|nr:putative protein TPRXL [Scleropages formosus]